jgi:hypothetical protein
MNNGDKALQRYGNGLDGDGLHGSPNTVFLYSIAQALRTTQQLRSVELAISAQKERRLKADPQDIEATP